LLSTAQGQRCIAITYGGFVDGAREKGPARIGGGEVCSPDDRRLAATSDQLFFDPRTGEMTNRPIRFVYGFVDDAASDVRLTGPDGSTTELRLSDVPGRAYKVFAGAAPRTLAIGRAVVEGTTSAGEHLPSTSMHFAGPAHQSDAEARADAQDPFGD
jgi:hypothetical protein